MSYCSKLLVWGDMNGEERLYKFTIQFSEGDPLHQQTADILNRQGRRKAQFLVNAVMHYLHCSETPDIPQPPPIDTNAIEMIVRRIMAEESSKPIAGEQSIQPPAQRSIKSEQINFGDASDLLGEDGIAAIKNTMASFRK